MKQREFKITVLSFLSAIGDKVNIDNDKLDEFKEEYEKLL